MTTFQKIKTTFHVNWTTVLVGWKGLGVYSPWPERWIDFPPLLSVREIADFAEERLEASQDSKECELIAALLSPSLPEQSRQQLTSTLRRLSEQRRGDQVLELRKWRLIRLQELLETVPRDPVYGLLALSEFWQEFGSPPDSPHEVQGGDSTTAPDDYYSEGNLDRLLRRHRAWLSQEMASIREQDRNDLEQNGSA